MRCRWHINIFESTNWPYLRSESGLTRCLWMWLGGRSCSRRSPSSLWACVSVLDAGDPCMLRLSFSFDHGPHLRCVLAECAGDGDELIHPMWRSIVTFFLSGVWPTQIVRGASIANSAGAIINARWNLTILKTMKLFNERVHYMDSISKCVT